MFALFRRKNPYEQPAEAVYGAILQQVRQPGFYRDFGVPDTQEARFDLLLAHAFLVIDRVLDEKDFTQALFDVIFADMDQTLREIGIGDMGVPKRMRRMMKAFNGRMHAYNAAARDELKIKEALARNLYGTIANPQDVHLNAMADYIKRSRDLLQHQAREEILAGHVAFAEV